MTKRVLVKSMNMPMPSGISYFWNYGSLLGLCLVFQILTGLFLSFYYCSDISLSFDSINHIMRNVSGGDLIRLLHVNGASMFFMLVYVHIGRGIYFGSYYLSKVWFSGVVLFLVLMMTAFIGYVLPWGQMSFWGATVITNLITAVPYLGKTLVLWVWGGFSVEKATLSRFFSLHFLIPFLLAVMVLVHIFFLHEVGSSSPMGVSGGYDKIPFGPYFLWKDILGVVFFMGGLVLISVSLSYFFMDSDNFIPANPLVTPPHIQPEWYFLFAYAILRSVPNKFGGVMALLSSIMILLVLSLKKGESFSMGVRPLAKFVYFVLVFTFVGLTWLGSCPVEAPYIFISQALSVLYFMVFFLIFILG